MPKPFFALLLAAALAVSAAACNTNGGIPANAIVNPGSSPSPTTSPSGSPGSGQSRFAAHHHTAPAHRHIRSRRGH